MQDYRQLRVWKSGIALAINVRRATNGFPRSGYSELKAQMISAAESIVNNIVEGCGSETPKEFARYLTIAIKSATELEGELQLARAYRIIPHPEWDARSSETILLRKMLYALRSRLQRPGRPHDPSRSISHPQPSDPKP
jgi:four helix bundle protein